MKIIFAMLLAMVISLQAAAPPRGADRLRELVVFPEIKINFSFGLKFAGNHWSIWENEDTPAEIGKERDELKRQPEDAARLLHLGQLLDDTGDTNGSVACYQKVEQLCRNQAGANPSDGWNLTVLATALDAQGKGDEAESVYRHATLVSPDEWRCWMALGNFLGKNSVHALFPQTLRNQVLPLDQPPPSSVLDHRPSPDALNQSVRQSGEAAHCFAQAVALAPGEPQVYLQLAGYMSTSNWQNCLYRHFHNQETISATEWRIAFFSRATTDSLKKAAALSPRNFGYISMAAYFDWFHAIILAQGSPDRLPDATRQAIHEAMTRLEHLAEDPDPELAAGALENLGYLNLAFGNGPGAIGCFRRAVALAPGREQAWDMWIASQAQTASPEEITSLCETRLSHNPTAHNHLLLARALVKEKKWELAATQARAVLALEPDNVPAMLDLVALTLRQSDNPEYLNQVPDQLNSLKEIWGKHRAQDDHGPDWRALIYVTFLFQTGQSAGIAKSKPTKELIAINDKTVNREPTPTEIDASLTGLKIKSPIFGVIILSISIIFFYLYLVHIYPIDLLQMNKSQVDVQSGLKAIEGTQQR